MLEEDNFEPENTLEADVFQTRQQAAAAYLRSKYNLKTEMLKGKLWFKQCLGITEVNGYKGILQGFCLVFILRFLILLVLAIICITALKRPIHTINWPTGILFYLFMFFHLLENIAIPEFIFLIPFLVIFSFQSRPDKVLGICVAVLLSFILATLCYLVLFYAFFYYGIVMHMPFKTLFMGLH